jgi:hypothetical protein
MGVITQPQYFTINGVRFQHASLELNFGIPGFGLPTLGLQSIDYENSLEPGELRGTNPAVLATTTGKYSAKAKLKLPKSEGNYLVQQISLAAAAAPDPFTGLVSGYGQWQWVGTLNYYDTGNPLQTDILYGARIMKDADASKIGPDPLYMDFDLHLMALNRNGFWMVNPAIMGAVYGG